MAGLSAMRSIKSTPIQARRVVCIYCRRPQEVGTLALSLPCRFCHKVLSLEDIHITGYTARSVLETCGQVIIEQKGDVTVGSVTCSSLHLAGKLKGNIICLGPVTIAPTASLTGDITAPQLTVMEGARLKGKWTIAGA